MATIASSAPNPVFFIREHCQTNHNQNGTCVTTNIVFGGTVTERALYGGITITSENRQWYYPATTIYTLTLAKIDAIVQRILSLPPVDLNRLPPEFTDNSLWDLASEVALAALQSEAPQMQRQGLEWLQEDVKFYFRDWADRIKDNIEKYFKEHKSWETTPKPSPDEQQQFLNALLRTDSCNMQDQSFCKSFCQALWWPDHLAHEECARLVWDEIQGEEVRDKYVHSSCIPICVLDRNGLPGKYVPYYQNGQLTSKEELKADVDRRYRERLIQWENGKADDFPAQAPEGFTTQQWTSAEGRIAGTIYFQEDLTSDEGFQIKAFIRMTTPEDQRQYGKIGNSCTIGSRQELQDIIACLQQFDEEEIQRLPPCLSFHPFLLGMLSVALQSKKPTLRDLAKTLLESSRRAAMEATVAHQRRYPFLYTTEPETEATRAVEAAWRRACTRLQAEEKKE